MYSADDHALGRKVAVKVLRHLDDDGVRRFQREARILADLGSHENLAVIYRFAETRNGNPCFVMEYVPGGSLADSLTHNGAVEVKTAISYASQVSRALMHTHARGIVHRDIKPSNILLATDGRVKLSDFGIAVIRSASATLNAATFEHAAPEVFLNGATKNDERSDLYSLCSTLFNLIDGSAPYHIDGERSHEALLNRVLNGPIPVTDRAPQLNGFWVKALAKDPDARFQTAAELLAALTALSRETPPSPTRADAQRGRSQPSQPPGPPPPGSSVPPPPWPDAQPSRSASTPPPPPPPAGKVTVSSTVGITATGGQPLSPQEVAVVDSFVASPSAAQRRDVAALTTTQSVLFTLAQDRDDTVATIAVPRITDHNLLGQLIEPERPKRTRVLAAGRITNGPLAERLAADPDADVRAALASGVSDPSIIQRLIVDPAESVRSAVIAQIQNPKVLRLVAQSPDPETRRAIGRHLDPAADVGGLLTTLARDNDASVREVALGRIDARTVLELAANHDEAVSRSAIRFVRDPEALHRLSRHPTPHVQLHAVAQIADVETLAHIAGDTEHPRWREALDRIDDEPSLAALARSGNDRIAEAALARIPEGRTLAALAADPGYRFRLEAADRITDRMALESLAAGADQEVADRARGALSELSERSERLATARLLAAGVLLAALAMAIAFQETRLLAILVIAAVVVAYRSYASRQVGRLKSGG